MSMIARGPQHPASVELGQLILVLPTADSAIPRRQWADLSCAVILDAAGDQVLAQSLVATVEAKLGVNAAHRRALASSPAAVTSAIAAAHARRIDAEEARIEHLGRRLRDPEFVAKIGAAERSAHEKRAEAASLRIIGPKLHRKAAKVLDNQARAFDEEAARLAKEEADQDLLCGDAREPVILAKLRGEEIEAREVEIAEVVTDEYGARVTHRRGPSLGLPVLKITRQTRAQKLSGIAHAYANGNLDGERGGARQADMLLETGRAYGEAYEIDAGLTSNSGGGGGGFGPKGPQIRQVEAGETLGIMRRSLSQRQRTVLDLVCGQGLRAREAADLMKAGFPATARALRGGLRAAGEDMAGARAFKEVGQAGARVKAAHQVLSRYRL